LNTVRAPTRIRTNGCQPVPSAVQEKAVANTHPSNNFVTIVHGGAVLFELLDVVVRALALRALQLADVTRWGLLFVVVADQLLKHDRHT